MVFCPLQPLHLLFVIDEVLHGCNALGHAKASLQSDVHCVGADWGWQCGVDRLGDICERLVSVTMDCEAKVLNCPLIKLEWAS